jgi:hypothetical protein
MKYWLNENAHVLCKEINVPAFDIEGHVVWGATMMLSELKMFWNESWIQEFDFA